VGKPWEEVERSRKIVKRSGKKGEGRGKKW
jgi:hypothetical protein